MMLKLFCVLFLSTALYAQDDQKALEEEFRRAQQFEVQQQTETDFLQRAADLPIDQIISFLANKEIQKLESFEEAQVSQVSMELTRLELIIYHEKQKLAHEKAQQITVAILGDSSLPVDHGGFNDEVLAALLKQIKSRNPAAVFFTGNLVYSLSMPAKNANAEEVQLNVTKNIFGTVVNEDQGIFNAKDFAAKLAQFSQVVQENLGNIPFYPLIGEQEAMGSEAIEVFKNQFKLNNAEILNGTQLVYSVPVGNSLFVALTTDELSSGQRETVGPRLAPELLVWLQNVLAGEGSKYQYRFVLGNDPAYSTTASFGIYQGLDKNRVERDQFWNLLRQYRVTAYFSGNEVLYDRTYRFGVWQLISGGAGATHDYYLKDDTFYHYMMLSIPQQGSKNPRLRVYNLEGKLKDEVALSSQAPPPIFQFRISKSQE